MRQPIDYYALPDPVVGYPPQLDGAFSVIIPEATANLCTNPSFEINTSGHAALNGAIAQTATKQRRGVYACQVTPNANVESGDYFSLALTAGQPYAFSVDLWGETGKWYNLYVADSSNNRLSPLTRFQGTGFWERVSVIYYESTGATRRFFLTRSAYADTNVFYTDGWQIENKDHDTTYCDGDMVGFIRNQVDFGWSGTPQASASWRSGQTKAGGNEVNLKVLGLTILSVIGLGLSSIGNIAIPNVDGGSYYQTSVRKDRQFTIAGQLSGVGLPDLQRTRKGLQSALDVFNTAKRQPLVLTYQLQDEDGHPISEKVNIRGLYNSGLGGQYDNNHAENVGVVFDSYLPAIMNEGDKGQVLSFQQTVANANYILERDNTGLWKALSTGVNNNVYVIAIGPDGSVYLGGSFTNVGDANGDYIVKWTGSAWVSLGTGMNGTVRALAVGPDGSLYAGGAFTLAGGVANTAYLAKWNGTTWVALGTGMDATVYALTVGPDGVVYAGGDFTHAGGVAAHCIAKWDGATWVALGTGTSSSVYALVVGPGNLLYVGGAFTLAGGVADTADIAKWDGLAWTPLGTGTAGTVFSLVIGPDGILYSCGSFTHIGGNSANYVAKWNGSAWSPLGTGTGGLTTALTIGIDNNLYAGGYFTNAGGLNLPDSLAMWNGSSWVYMNVDEPGSPTTNYALATDNAGNLYIGYSDSGSATTAYVTTVTNSGSADTYPKVTFTGPGSVYQLRNVTTGKTIYFNLTLNAGEVATLNLDPNALSFTSSFRGNIRDAILRGSDLNLYLQPGDNLISVFVAGTTTAATKVTMIDREAYNSLDGTIR